MTVRDEAKSVCAAMRRRRVCAPTVTVSLRLNSTTGLQTRTRTGTRTDGLMGQRPRVHGYRGPAGRKKQARGFVCSLSSRPKRKRVRVPAAAVLARAVRGRGSGVWASKSQSYTLALMNTVYSPAMRHTGDGAMYKHQCTRPYSVQNTQAWECGEEEGGEGARTMIVV